MTSPFEYKRTLFPSQRLNLDVHYGVLTLASEYRESLYLFHGGNGDDQQFVQAELIRAISPKNLELLRSRKVRIVLPFIGVSLLHGGYSDYFFSELLPHLENDPSRVLHIGGWSMGGFAALSAFFRFPDLFQSVGAHFPSLIHFNFFDPAQAAGFAARNQIDPQHLEIILAEFKKSFSSIEEFRKADPLHLVGTIDASLLNSKKIYFDVGSKDEFGLYEGSNKFHEILKANNVSHEYALIADGHHDAPFLQKQLNALIHSALFIS